MDQLGEARKPKCRHAVKVHGKLARAAIRAMKGPLLTLEANAEDEAENNGYWSAIDDVRELFNAALETP
jgi:transcription initiation factor IIE alpha subunit